MSVAQKCPCSYYHQRVRLKIIKTAFYVIFQHNFKKQLNSRAHPSFQEHQFLRVKSQLERGQWRPALSPCHLLLSPQVEQGQRLSCMMESLMEESHTSPNPAKEFAKNGDSFYQSPHGVPETASCLAQMRGNVQGGCSGSRRGCWARVMELRV